MRAVGTDPRVHRALAEESRVRLLELLRDSSTPLSTGQLAQRTGLHATTVRSHLEVLVDAELVTTTREARTTPGRPRILYAAVAFEPEPQEMGYRLLAEILASELAATSEHPSARALAAGAVWGEYLVPRPQPFTQVTAEHARSELLALLERLGFAPEIAVEPGAPSEGDELVRLRRCPFIDVARERSDVVCAVHLGLMRGAVAALDAPLHVEELVPFAEPDACTVRLRVASVE
jgi:predicted ArsR family transcriptional regulator